MKHDPAFLDGLQNGVGASVPGFAAPAAPGAGPAAPAMCTCGCAAGFVPARAPLAGRGESFRAAGAHALLLLAAAFGLPVLLDTTVFSPEAAAIPELAPWTLMLVGFVGTAVTLRARHARLPR